MKRSRYKLVGLIGICMLLVGCQKASGITRYSVQSFEFFDTVTEMIGFADSQEIFSNQVKPLEEELREYHQLYDIYNDYNDLNNLKTINDNAGVKPVKVDKRIIDLLLFGKEMYEKTDGKVNIAYGSVLSIWHTYRTEGLEDPKHAKIPPMVELEEASKHVDIEKVIIDKEDSTVYLEDEKMSLDVGAVGKGYAVEQITTFAKNQGIHRLLISVGGNISAIGTREDSSKWKLGIQNPDLTSDTAYLLKVEMENQSLVTSGNYQRYYEVGGKIYHHIIDPDTLMPATYFASVSIINKQSGVADSLSTALYNMPKEDGLALIEGLSNTEAVWVYEDGHCEYSSGFKDYIAEK